MQYGCIKSPMDLRNYRICKTSLVDELPDAFELPHSHIKNQGSVNSCVAHSVSEVLETFDNINYSTGWIYGYRPENSYQGMGMSINTAIGTIHKLGYLTNDELDKNVEMSEAKEIVDANLEEYKNLASKRKIVSYAYLKTIDEVKQALYLEKTPIVMSIDISLGGLELDDEYVAKQPIKLYGGHAVVCYGWNKIGFLIQNSWGEEWGNKGCFILPYDYYELYNESLTEEQIRNHRKKEYPFDEAWLVSFKKTEIIEKPNYYWLRELIMKIIKFIRLFLKGE